eukprot:CAMPEP_0194136850 /NCGR_PEP_ID=MMETSP0152-20130528/6815_1 /TAXON_ID=1049557 /ORGANISM="Thalassiothrix antarctica, Strain L6-D1" /LENGTH=187 /DNA_ID=CAMNT_0038833653 /DNA_START=33 /DNA_END=596 /DNA_ORIENTATION=-
MNTVLHTPRDVDKATLLMTDVKEEEIDQLDSPLETVNIIASSNDNNSNNNNSGKQQKKKAAGEEKDSLIENDEQKRLSMMSDEEYEAMARRKFEEAEAAWEDAHFKGKEEEVKKQPQNINIVDLFIKFANDVAEDQMQFKERHAIIGKAMTKDRPFKPPLTQKTKDSRQYQMVFQELELTEDDNNLL